MIFISILILIVAIALPSINKLISPILFTRISSIIFIYSGLFQVTNTIFNNGYYFLLINTQILLGSTTNFLPGLKYLVLNLILIPITSIILNSKNMLNIYLLEKDISDFKGSLELI